MKLLRAKKSTTFKTHFFSALCRSLFTNTSLIFANSVFVKSAGAENYSRLFFFASLAALIYYIFFAIAGDKQAYSVYKAVIGLTLLASILCFLEPFWPPLEPYNIPLLYFFAVAVMVVDLIGTTVGPVVLQLSVNPAIFREVFQKIVTAELLARISAAGLIWVLSINHWLVFWYPIGWLTLVIHFVLFQVTLIRLRRVERSDKESVEQRDVVLIIGSSLKFVLTNPMVRVAMSIMMWGNVTKFVIECLFYHVADDRFSSARQIASFMSVVTMTMIMLSLVVQHLMGKKLIRRLQLSTLFSFQPVNILILGCIALMIQPFWPVVVLLVTYTIINRSIQLPVSRQCLVPVPRGQRSTIVSLICINMSIATLLASGILAVMKSSLALQDFLVVLLVLGGGIFFLITGLDSYYIRNLWSFYRESRSGHWQDEPVTESLTSVELDLPGTIETPFQFGPGADWKSHVILDTYSTSFDRFRLAQASRAHKQLLGSGDTQVVLLGLRICFVAGFPWFTSIFKKSLSHDCKEVRNFARQAIWVQESFADLSGYSSVFRRKLRSLALEFVEDASGSGNVTRLRELTNLPDHQAAESMVAALS
ncbi:MAG: hypothetical protein K8F91_02725, partial [Candidatus Obscuribacterales bacterium]|nr:hypothetical protein [Candidatus Obscuribacterales bacterium]